MTEHGKDRKHNWFEVHGDIRLHNKMTVKEFGELLDSLGIEFLGSAKISVLTDEAYAQDPYVFPAIFDYAPDGINVSFPDLQGCFTCGADEQEAFYMAKDVLEGFLYSLEQRQEPIPEPSSLKDIETKQNERVILIEVKTKPLA